MESLFGGIEAGGTKIVCMVARSQQDIRAEMQFATTEPVKVLPCILEFFSPYAREGRLAAVGIGSFGPLDLDPGSATYGYITTTPKQSWAGTDLNGAVRRGLNVPVAFDTDVNAAAIGEQYWVRENRMLDPFLYVTVGTGVGVGVIVNGRPVHGLIHPEAGHYLIPHDWQADPFKGVCPYHGDCLEGLASGPAIEKRWMRPPESLPPDHPAWELEASYIAMALANLMYSFSPKRIVLGGGVMNKPGLYASVRRKVQKWTNGYLKSNAIQDTIDTYIVPPALGSRSGALGAVAMAIETIFHAASPGAAFYSA